MPNGTIKMKKILSSRSELGLHTAASQTEEDLYLDQDVKEMQGNTKVTDLNFFYQTLTKKLPNRLTSEITSIQPFYNR